MVRSFLIFLISMLILVTAGTALAQIGDYGHRPALQQDSSQLLGAVTGHSKARVDSVLLMGPWGGSAPYNGQFEDIFGTPAWNGWTHHDLTRQEESRWHVSDYRAEVLAGHGAGNLALWCGETIYPACSPDDPEGGYGDNYVEAVRWQGTVADPAAPCQVTIDAYLNHDMENGFDFLYLQVVDENEDTRNIWYATGTAENLHLHETFQVLPSEYTGPGAVKDQVTLQFLVITDAGYSDEDCQDPSAGACQIDDINVHLDNGGFSTYTNFQAGETGAWVPTLAPYVGDFAQLWTNLDEIDPCNSNWSSQVAFIDDGMVVPGVGPSTCLTWCYGPAGYVVNFSGGLAGEDHALQNQIRSPVIPWPGQTMGGALFDFDVFRHEDLAVNSTQIFFTWEVRSVATGNPADIEDAPWVDSGFFYMGAASYRRFQNDISSMLVPGATHVQVAMSVLDLDLIAFWGDGDGTPAPYFDNVRLTAFTFGGPAISARETEIAQDGFPATGTLDLNDPGSLSVRFDMAKDVTAYGPAAPDPGDSVVATIIPRRPGAALVELPRLHYRLDANPAFAEYRTSGLPASGSVAGVHVVLPSGTVVEDRFAFDLPDTGFLFPGDLLHYYISATSELEGDLRTATLPSDTTGFADFQDSRAYDQDFTVRALPTLSRLHTGEIYQRTNTLLWLDGNDDEVWAETLAELYVAEGMDVDLFTTRSPISAVGNGLGSRASATQLDGYSGLMYTAGDLGSFTITTSALDIDSSDDLGLITEWLEGGERTLLISGDNVVSDLIINGSDAGQTFVQEWLKVDLVDHDLRPLINGQVAPLVRTSAPLSGQVLGWVAFGGCPDINTFDALEVVPGGTGLAEFTDPSGQVGAYSYTALAYHDLAPAQFVLPGPKPGVYTMPMGLETVYSSPDIPHGNCSARGQLLASLLDDFGVLAFCGTVGPVELPEAQDFSVQQYPNPFNPRTTISYNMAVRGHLEIQVYDLKGRLVNTLLSEEVDAGPGEVVWSGRDAQGQVVSSGVYFCQVKGAGRTLVRKMMLMK